MNEVPHYNAFISYRHHPQDIAVAEAIHKGLERFKVPSSLRKQGKKIERLFRDKEELPITSSLTDTITQALEHSDYLIVICSTHLQESYWVIREIETFLKTHTKDQILTVIVDGEPQDVIPEILTYRDVIDPVTGETIREPLEPLSCDWRMPKRKAMKVELPRLAAVLLGCTYNDLIQRQKQYRMRRLAIGAGVGMVASLALAGYFLYTSIQIQENLDQSLRNQSQYLASTSETLFDSGDRLSAIALALEALPDQGNQRPYVVSAENALSDALMLYDPTTDIIAVGAYSADTLVSDFVLTDDGSTLYILDTLCGVTTWDTESFSQIASFKMDRNYATMFASKEGNLLALDGEDGQLLKCFSPAGDLLWQLDDIYSIALLDGKETLLATTKVFGDMHYLLYLDPATGKQLRAPVPVCPEKDYYYVNLNSTNYYENMPLPVTLQDTPADISAIFDPATGKLTKLVASENLLYVMNALPDGRTVICQSDGTGEWNGRVMDMTTVSTAGADLYCFSSDGKQLWRTKLTNYLYSNTNTIAPVPESEDIFVQFGNGLFVVDGSSGKITSHVYASSYPLTMLVDEPDRAWGFFGDGTMGNFYFDRQELSTIRYMESGLTDAVVNHGGYVSKELSYAITKYASTADESYESFDKKYGSYISDSAFNENHLVIDAWNSISLYDLNTRRQLWTTEARTNGDYYDLLGFSADGSTLYSYSSYKGLRTYDVLTGKQSDLPFPQPEAGYANYGKYPLLSNGKLYYLQDVLDFQTGDPARVELGIWNLRDNTHTYSDILPEAYADGWSIHSNDIRFLYADDTRLLMRMHDGALYEYLFSDGSSREVLAEVPEVPVFLTNSDPFRLTIAVGTEILTLDENCEVLSAYALPEARAVSLFPHEDTLYALGDDGHTYCFDKDGNLLSASTMSLYTNFYSDVKYLDSMEVDISWGITPDNQLVVGAANMGNLIPIGENAYCTDIPHLICYHAATDSFICSHDTGIIAYRRLSTAQVMERGRETLGTFELTEEQKTAYGLN